MEQVRSERSFGQLSAELTNLLTSKGYGADTMANYHRTLSSIGKFMIVEDLSNYSEAVGEAYLAERLSCHVISKSYQLFLKMVVRRLNDLYVGIGFRFVEKKTTQSIPAQCVDLLESYLRSCRYLGNKEGTIAGKRRFCGQFLCYLSDLGCSKIQDINTEYICRADCTLRQQRRLCRSAGVLALLTRDRRAEIRLFWDNPKV